MREKQMPYKLVTSHLAHINLHHRPPGLTGSIFLPEFSLPSFLMSTLLLNTFKNMESKYADAKLTLLR